MATIAFFAVACAALKFAGQQSVVKERYVDESTGEYVPDYEPPEDHGTGVGIYRGRQMIRSSTPGVRLTRLPESRTFMLIGHLLWGMILGFVGGGFARFVYAKRD